MAQRDSHSEWGECKSFNSSIHPQHPALDVCQTDSAFVDDAFGVKRPSSVIQYFVNANDDMGHEDSDRLHTISLIPVI